MAPGGELTFDIWVDTVRPGGVQPGGTVAILLEGADVSGPIRLYGIDDVSAGVEVTITAPTMPGTGSIGAAYSGDEDTNASSAPTFRQTILASPAAASPSTAPSVVATRPPPAATTRAALTVMTKPLLTTLRKRGLAALASVEQTLTPAAPGTLTQFVYSPAAPTSVAQARSAKAKPVLRASGSRRFSQAGRGILRLRLTATGRRLSRRGRSLKLQIITRFKATTGRTVSTSTRLSLQARR